MKFKLTTISITLVLITCFIIDFSLKNWEKRDRVVEYDVHSYYAYLPAQFIYDDIELKKSDYVFDGDYYLFWPTTTPEGHNVIKTSMGAAILYAPFFFVAHAYTINSNYPVNGFSEPYKIFLLLSTLFYLFVGLDFLKKILLRLGFSDSQTAITILILGVGTNLLCYSSQSAPMPHVYSFCLFAIFTYYTLKWYEKQSIKNSLIIGLTFGLISLVRPSNAVIVLFFVLYGVSSWQEFKGRLLLFKSKFLTLFLIAFCCFIVWIPQFIYWKVVTGNFLFYPYTDEGFYFSEPKIILGLFSFQKGWLIYTPIMIFSLIGLFLLKDSLKKLFYTSILIFFTVNIYIVFSWWCWWYGGAFGQRTLIESYAILAIPLAGFIKHISEKKNVVKIIFYSICGFFIWLNIFQTYQFEHMSLHYEGMTKELYFKQFGKYDKIPDFDQYVNPPDYEYAKTRGKKPVIEQVDSTMAEGNKKEQEKKSINLMAMNGKYLSPDEGSNELIFANRDKANAWENFTLVLSKNNTCTLLSYKNLYFSANLGDKGQLEATRTAVAEWETFTLVKLDNNNVAFKAINDKYLTVDAKTGQLFATANSVGKNETFVMIVK